MFYFDENLKEYESKCLWDKSLIYLENLFLNDPTCDKLNSLVGFAWYYLIEGPVVSKKYGKDENIIAMDIWEKYIDVGFEQYSNNFGFCFIAGYALLMHGFYIDKYKYFRSRFHDVKFSPPVEPYPQDAKARLNDVLPLISFARLPQCQV